MQTVDFFTPIVDDPFTFGAIAAANSLSDVYAMGGKPISASRWSRIPANGDPEFSKRSCAAASKRCAKPDCAVLGGHSVADSEIKFGYAVTGTIHPDRVKANSGARPGDALVFTKAIGTGVIGTALKLGIASDDSVEASIASMLTLNRAACEAMLEFDTHGCTDVSGFGFLGHAREMALASHVTLEIETARIRLLPGALDAARAGAIPGGLKNNRDFVSPVVQAPDSFDAALLELLYDPQTSGGLLISLAAADAAALERRLPGAHVVGRVLPRDNKSILLL